MIQRMIRHGVEKMNKRVWIPILILVTVLSVLFLSGAACADTQAGFSYVVLSESDGTASITGCSLSGDVVIPSQIDGYTVINLARELFFGNGSVTSVYIPETVTYFGDNRSDNMWDYVFSYCYNLKSITVHEGNPSFSSVDGVLYNKQKTVLINYPCGKSNSSFHVAGSVGTLCCTSFASCNNLKSLYLDGTGTWWYTYTFFNDGGLTVYYSEGGSTEQKVDQEISNGMYHEKDSSRPIFRKLGSTTGWYKDGDNWYYYDSNGVMQTGWQSISSKWYYLNDDGIMQSGWIQLGGKWYYLANDMKTGWQKISNEWYYFSSDGIMQSGWIQLGSKWYYLGNEMKTGWLQIGNKWYYFSSAGIMQSGWIRLGGKWYYLGNEMKTGWQKINSKWYYFNTSGVMQSGWIQLSGKWYYLGNEMKTGWQQINSKWYYFNTSGVMQTGWFQLSGKWYYLGSDGAMATGTQLIGGKTYIFDSNGVWQP